MTSRFTYALLGLIYVPAALAQESMVVQPGQQQQFVEAIIETRERYYRQHYMNRPGSDAIARELLSERARRHWDILGPELTFDNWQAFPDIRVRPCEKGAEEPLCITTRFEIGPHVLLNIQHHVQLFFSGPDTRVRADSELGHQIRQLSNGDEVRISGRFVDLTETSWTQDGEVREPEYLFELTAIEELDEARACDGGGRHDLAPIPRTPG